jgi:NADH dehydrogenase FAD-containing subunit
MKDEDIFKPIDQALKKYPASSYEFIIGTAEEADFNAKSVRITTAAGESQTLTYDHLVLGTGSHTAGNVPWKAEGSYEEVLALLKQTEDKVAAASHIVVAGAGSTGIEVAGELAFEFGKTKEIVLLSATDKLINGDLIAGPAANELKKLNAKVQYNARVKETHPSAADPAKTDVVLENGETITTDLYLPTMGLIPNTTYVPAEYLTENKLVDVDEFLHVKGTTNVWAAGDVVSKPRAGFMITQKQAAGLSKNLELVLAGKEPIVAKGLPMEILACAVGRSRGAGRMNTWKLPSFMVYMAKGKTMGLNMMGGYIDGSIA